MLFLYLFCCEFSWYHAIGNLIDTFSNSNHSWCSILQTQHHRCPILTRIFNNEKITNIFWILLRGLYGKHKHLSCGVILLWKFAFFAPFFDLDQIFATLVANVADMDGDGWGEIMLGKVASRVKQSSIFCSFFSPKKIEWINLKFLED